MIFLKTKIQNFPKNTFFEQRRIFQEISQINEVAESADKRVQKDVDNVDEQQLAAQESALRLSLQNTEKEYPWAAKGYRQRLDTIANKFRSLEATEEKEAGEALTRSSRQTVRELENLRKELEERENVEGRVEQLLLKRQEITARISQRQEILTSVKAGLEEDIKENSRFFKVPKILGGQNWKESVGENTSQMKHIRVQLEKDDTEVAKVDTLINQEIENAFTKRYAELKKAGISAPKMQLFLLQTYDILGAEVADQEFQTAIQKAQKKAAAGSSADNFKRAYYAGDYTKAFETAVEKYSDAEFLHEIVSKYEEQEGRYKRGMEFTIPILLPERFQEELTPQEKGELYKNWVKVKRNEDGSIRIWTDRSITAPGTDRVRRLPPRGQGWEKTLTEAKVTELRSQREENKENIKKTIGRIPEFDVIKAAGKDLQDKFVPLQELVQMGAEGGKTKEFVSMAQGYARDILNSKDKIEELRANSASALQTLEKLKVLYTGSELDEFEQQITQMEKAFGQIMDVTTTDQIEHFCNTILNPAQFGVDNPKRWLTTEGIVFISTIAIAVLATIAAINFWNPGGWVAAAGIGALGGAVGGIVGQEVGHIASDVVGSVIYEGEEDVDFSHKSMLGKKVTGEQIYNAETGEYEDIAMADLGKVYGEQFVNNFVTTFALLGLGKLAGEVLSKFAAANRTTAGFEGTMARLIDRLPKLSQQKIDLLTQKGLKSFTQRLGKEVLEEFGEEGLEAAAQKTDSRLGFLVSVYNCLDGRSVSYSLGKFGVTPKGRIVSGSETSPTVQSVFEFNAADQSVMEAKVRAEYEAQGFQVKTEGERIIATQQMTSGQGTEFTNEMVFEPSTEPQSMRQLLSEKNTAAATDELSEVERVYGVSHESGNTYVAADFEPQGRIPLVQYLQHKGFSTEGDSGSDEFRMTHKKTGETIIFRIHPAIILAQTAQQHRSSSEGETAVRDLKEYCKTNEVSDRTRIHIVETLLGRHLSSNERNTLIEAHNLQGNIDELSPAELRAKTRKLSESFTSTEERRLLIEAGIAGNFFPSFRHNFVPGKEALSTRDRTGREPIQTDTGLYSALKTHNPDLRISRNTDGRYTLGIRYRSTGQREGEGDTAFFMRAITELQLRTNPEIDQFVELQGRIALEAETASRISREGSVQLEQEFRKQRPGITIRNNGDNRYEVKNGFVTVFQQQTETDQNFFGRAMKELQLQTTAAIDTILSRRRTSPLTLETDQGVETVSQTVTPFQDIVPRLTALNPEVQITYDRGNQRLSFAETNERESTITTRRATPETLGEMIEKWGLEAPTGIRQQLGLPETPEYTPQRITRLLQHRGTIDHWTDIEELLPGLMASTSLNSTGVKEYFKNHFLESMGLEARIEVGQLQLRSRSGPTEVVTQDITSTEEALAALKRVNAGMVISDQPSLNWFVIMFKESSVQRGDEEDPNAFLTRAVRELGLTTTPEVSRYLGIEGGDTNVTPREYLRIDIQEIINAGGITSEWADMNRVLPDFSAYLGSESGHITAYMQRYFRMQNGILETREEGEQIQVRYRTREEVLADKNPIHIEKGSRLSAVDMYRIDKTGTGQTINTNFGPLEIGEGSTAFSLIQQKPGSRQFVVLVKIHANKIIGIEDNRPLSERLQTMHFRPVVPERTAEITSEIRTRQEEVLRSFRQFADEMRTQYETNNASPARMLWLNHQLSILEQRVLEIANSPSYEYWFTQEQIFISYSHQDSKPESARLQRAFHNLGGNTYRDETDFTGFRKPEGSKNVDRKIGDSWVEQAREGIENATAGVILISEAGLRSPQIDLEIRQLQKSEKPIFLVVSGTLAERQHLKTELVTQKGTTINAPDIELIEVDGVAQEQEIAEQVRNRLRARRAAEGRLTSRARFSETHPLSSEALTSQEMALSGMADLVREHYAQIDRPGDRAQQLREQTALITERLRQIRASAASDGEFSYTAESTFILSTTDSGAATEHGLRGALGRFFNADNFANTTTAATHAIVLLSPDAVTDVQLLDQWNQMIEAGIPIAPVLVGTPAERAETIRLLQQENPALAERVAGFTEQDADPQQIAESILLSFFDSDLQRAGQWSGAERRVTQDRIEGVSSDG